MIPLFHLGLFQAKVVMPVRLLNLNLDSDYEKAGDLSVADVQVMLSGSFTRNLFHLSLVSYVVQSVFVTFSP